MEEEGLVSFPERRQGSWGEGLSPIVRRMTLIMLYQWWGGGGGRGHREFH